MSAPPGRPAAASAKAPNPKAASAKAPTNPGKAAPCVPPPIAAKAPGKAAQAAQPKAASNQPPPLVSGATLRRVVEAAFALGVPKPEAKKWIDSMESEPLVRDDESFETYFREKQENYFKKQKRTENAKRKRERIKEMAKLQGVDLEEQEQQKKRDAKRRKLMDQCSDKTDKWGNLLEGRLTEEGVAKELASGNIDNQAAVDLRRRIQMQKYKVVGNMKAKLAEAKGFVLSALQKVVNHNGQGVTSIFFDSSTGGLRGGAVSANTNSQTQLETVVAQMCLLHVMADAWGELPKWTAAMETFVEEFNSSQNFDKTESGETTVGQSNTNSGDPNNNIQTTRLSEFLKYCTAGSGSAATGGAAANSEGSKSENAESPKEEAQREQKKRHEADSVFRMKQWFEKYLFQSGKPNDSGSAGTAASSSSASSSLPSTSSTSTGNAGNVIDESFLPLKLRNLSPKHVKRLLHPDKCSLPDCVMYFQRFSEAFQK